MPGRSGASALRPRPVTLPAQQEIDTAAACSADTRRPGRFDPSDPSVGRSVRCEAAVLGRRQLGSYDLPTDARLVGTAAEAVPVLELIT